MSHKTPSAPMGSGPAAEVDAQVVAAVEVVTTNAVMEAAIAAVPAVIRGEISSVRIGTIIENPTSY